MIIKIKYDTAKLIASFLPSFAGGGAHHDVHELK